MDVDVDVDNYVDFHQFSCCEHHYLKMQAQRTRDAIISHAGNLLVKNLCFFRSTTERSRERVAGHCAPPVPS